MGATFSMMFGNKEKRVVMVGLGAAEKTTILYKLKPGKVVDTNIPTVDLNVETVEYKNVSFNVLEVGGQTFKIQQLWRHYFHGTDGLIFVVDSNDRERITDARDDLHMMLSQDELKDAPILVFANKQDFPNAMSVSEITHKLGLHSFPHHWYVQPACAISGEGLFDGLDWLTSNCISS